MTRDELINTVKAKIDEIVPVGGLVVPLSGYDDKPLDVFIDYILDESGDEVQAAAPIWKLGAVACSASSHRINRYSGYVVLPEDFLRLIRFKMVCWGRSVTEPVFEGSVAADRQNNIVLRGGVDKPVCVVKHGFGKNKPQRVIEYYSVSGNNHNVEFFLYARRCVAEELVDGLLSALTWKASSKVLAIVGNSGYQVAEERFKSMINS